MKYRTGLKFTQAATAKVVAKTHAQLTPYYLLVQWIPGSPTCRNHVVSYGANTARKDKHARCRSAQLTRVHAVHAQAICVFITDTGTMPRNLKYYNIVNITQRLAFCCLVLNDSLWLCTHSIHLLNNMNLWAALRHRRDILFSVMCTQAQCWLSTAHWLV